MSSLAKIIVGLGWLTIGVLIACDWDINGSQPITQFTMSQVLGLGHMALGFVVLIAGIIGIGRRWR